MNSSPILAIPSFDILKIFNCEKKIVLAIASLSRNSDISSENCEFIPHNLRTAQKKSLNFEVGYKLRIARKQVRIVWWPRELNALQLQKTHANRKSTSKSRKYFHQFDNRWCKCSQHKQIKKHTDNTFYISIKSIIIDYENHRQRFSLSISRVCPKCPTAHSVQLQPVAQITALNNAFLWTKCI